MYPVCIPGIYHIAILVAIFHITSSQVVVVTVHVFLVMLFGCKVMASYLDISLSLVYAWLN